MISQFGFFCLIKMVGIPRGGGSINLHMGLRYDVQFSYANFLKCTINQVKYIEKFQRPEESPLWTRQKANVKFMRQYCCTPVCPLAPDPIKVQSCVWCLFWTNRNSMAETSIFLSISLSNQSYESFNRRYQWKYLLLLKL